MLLPQLNSQLILDKTGKITQWEKRIALQQMALGKLDSYIQKHKLLGLHQNKKLLHSKGNSEQNRKTTYGMGEDTCK